MNRDNIFKDLPAEVSAYIRSLEEQVRELKKIIFGSKSEKLTYVLPDEYTQLMLFDEAEVTAAPEETDEVIVVPAHTRKSKRTKTDLAEVLPVVEELHDIPEEARVCDTCSGQLEAIGKETVREEVSVIPQRAFVTRTLRVNYKCPCCDNKTGEPNIVKSPVPEPVIKRGLASPSSAAHVLYQKYVNAMPLYRQEKDWATHGVTLSRGTMANWVIYIAGHWLVPLWIQWKALLLSAPRIYADESVVQVLKEPGKSAQSQSRMWVYGSDAYPSRSLCERPECSDNVRTPANPGIILYEYQPDRSGKHARAFLRVDHPFYLHTDGYDGYEGIENAIRVGCWAHMRRKYNDAMPKSPPKDHPAYIGFQYCQKLFVLEQEYKKQGLSPEERLAARLKHSKPVVDAYYYWLENTLKPLYGGKLGTAVTYAKNQKVELCRFLETGLVELSTNFIENAIRPFALGRKSWLFADTQAGADASAITYSIIETAKVNGLNPYEYLLYLLTHLPTILTKNASADLSYYYPWAHNIAERCKNQRAVLDATVLGCAL